MQNLPQARVIDPILSNVVLGYKNADLVGLSLMPQVPTTYHGGKVLQFGKEEFILRDTERSPGAATKRIEVGYAGLPYALNINALEALVPDELLTDAAQVPGINLATESINPVMAGLALGREYKIATLARSIATYPAGHVVPLSGAAQFNNATSTPRANVRAAAQIIRSKIGKLPNTIIMRSEVLDILDEHPNVRDRLKYTSSESLTAEMLARYFGVKRVILGDAIYANDAGVFVDVWGKDMVLAYVPDSPAMREPSFGYTYTLKGHPSVAAPYRENNRRSWIYGLDYNYAPVIAANTAGFLIQNVIA